MTADNRHPTWVETFPGNLRWSNATQIVKGMAPWAAVSLLEVDKVCTRMRARQHESNLDQVWVDEWTRMADHVAAIADKAFAEGRKITAGNNYMRAGNYHYAAERFMQVGEPKLASYKEAIRCYHSAIKILYPEIEFVDVPYEGTSLAAFFLKARGVTSPAPTVVLFDGLDNCKEMSVIFAALDLAKRGISTLAIDGPGQGASLRLRGIHSRPDYEVAGIAAYDYVAKRADVDPKKVVIMGYSFGGYHAPRIAAFDSRYAACVAFGAMHWDVPGWQRELNRIIAANPMSSGSSNFVFRWVLGAPDNDTAVKWAEKYTLEGIAQNIQCPFLVVQGEDDRLVALKDAQITYDKVGSKKKTLKVFTREEGGAEHCQVDHRQMGVDYIADWIVENLGLPPR